MKVPGGDLGVHFWNRKMERQGCSTTVWATLCGDPKLVHFRAKKLVHFGAQNEVQNWDQKKNPGMLSTPKVNVVFVADAYKSKRPENGPSRHHIYLVRTRFGGRKMDLIFGPAMVSRGRVFVSWLTR